MSELGSFAHVLAHCGANLCDLQSTSCSTIREPLLNGFTNIDLMDQVIPNI